MRIVLRILTTLVLLVVLLLAAAAVYLSVFFDPNDYKSQLAAQVEQQTGRELTIGGDIELSVFPWVALGLGDVSLANAKGFEAPVFASVDEVRIGVKLLPLLQREVVMDTVTLHGLVLNLARDSAGHTNWDDLAQPGEEPAPEPQPEAGEGMPIAALAVGGVEISDSRVSWDDAQAGQQAVLRDLELETGAIEPGEPVDLELSFTVESTEPSMTAQLSLNTVLVVDLAAQRYSARDLELETVLTGDSLPASPMRQRVEADIEADLERQTATVANLLVATLGLELTGSVEATAILDAPQYTGELRLAQFSPKDLVERLGMPPVQTTDPAVLQAASLETRLSGTAERVELKPLTVRLDDTTVEGEAAVASFAGPAYRFDLLVDVIDVDRYLPPAGEADAPAEADAEPAPGAEPPGATVGVPLEPLRALDLEGRLRIAQLKVNNLDISDVLVKVDGKDGVLAVDPLSARLYEGSLDASARLDARADPPQTSVTHKLTGIQAGPLLADLVGKAQLTGRADLSADLAMAGLEPAGIKRTLDGNLSFAFSDGAVKGVNIARLIRQARARIKGETLPPEKKELQTDFSVLSGSATITDGLVRNDDLLMKSPLLRIEGEGQASLPKETIDYVITALIVGTLEGQGGRELEELKGVPIPVRIGGTFDQPSFKPDLKKVLETKAVEEVKKKAREEVEKKVQEKLGDKLKEQTGEQAKELLKGLFR